MITVLFNFTSQLIWMVSVSSPGSGQAHIPIQTLSSLRWGGEKTMKERVTFTGNDCVLTYCDLMLLSFVKVNISECAADYIHSCFIINLYIPIFYEAKL